MKKRLVPSATGRNRQSFSIYLTLNMFQPLLLLLAARFLAVTKAAPAATALPVVDLGYSLHEASSFNVGPSKESSFVSTELSTSRPGEHTTSRIFAMQSLRLETSDFVPLYLLRVATDPLTAVWWERSVLRPTRHGYSPRSNLCQLT